jgi:hypothetical protein
MTAQKDKVYWQKDVKTTGNETDNSFPAWGRQMAWFISLKSKQSFLVELYKYIVYLIAMRKGG